MSAEVQEDGNQEQWVALQEKLSSPIFILEGEAMNRQTFQEKTHSLSSTQLQRKLMTFDLRFDTLSEHLSNFARVINQHASILGSMYDDSQKKATKVELHTSFKKSGDTFDILDDDLLTQVVLQIKNTRQTDFGSSGEEKVKGSSNLLANKLDQAKTAISLLYRQNRELFERMDRAETRIKNLQDSKADIFDMDARIDRLRNEVYEKADEVQKVRSVVM